jgi:hypothetical protein
MKRTIFIDIDGVIFKQKPDLSSAMEDNMELCEGVLEKFNEWNWKNYNIILTTGRKESTRISTEGQLRKAGVYWDLLIMGLDAGGQRILINNLKESNDTPTAVAINLKQDEGLKNVRITD